MSFLTLDARVVLLTRQIDFARDLGRAPATDFRALCWAPNAAELPDWLRTLIQATGYRIQAPAECTEVPRLIVFCAASRSNHQQLRAPANTPTILLSEGGTALVTDRLGRAHMVPRDDAQRLRSLLCSLHNGDSGSTQIVGNSTPARDLKQRIVRIAASSANVLVTGESGTGKELVASMLHECSSRHLGTLQSVNCAAIPDTLVESELFGSERGAFTGATKQRDGAFLRANGGTLFLDEIGDMSLYSQAKVLRVLESRRVARLGSSMELPIDVRIVAASNRNLHEMMRRGTFRQDLYYRLAVVELALPPLRDRMEDLPFLISHFARHLSAQLGQIVEGASENALALLKQYNWPGNVRELRNLVEAALIECRGRLIEVGDLPQSFCQRLSLADKAERERIVEVLASANGNKSLAAKRLHCSRVTLYRKLARHGIEVAEVNPAGEAD